MNDNDMHAVFATDYEHGIYRVSEDLSWNGAQHEWQRLDGLRIAGRMPHVKHFEVRSVEDPKYRSAATNFKMLHPVLAGSRGFATKENAARAAWKRYAPTFRSRWDKSGSDKQARTGVQGTGGWFYYPNGATAAQGLRSLAVVAERRGLIVQGGDGRWYIMDDDIDADRAVAA